MAKSRHLKDWVKIFFDAPFFAKPGKTFMYVNDNFYMLSKGMVTKETPGGYKGRAGLYETIVVDEDIQKLVKHYIFQHIELMLKLI